MRTTGIHISHAVQLIHKICQVAKQRASLAHRSLNLLIDPLTSAAESGNNDTAPLASTEDDDQAAIWLEEDASLLFDKSDVSDMLKVSPKSFVLCKQFVYTVHCSLFQF